MIDRAEYDDEQGGTEADYLESQSDGGAFDYMDAGEPVVGATALSEVMSAVTLLRDQRAEIERLEELLSDAKKVEERLSMEVVPQMLDNHGVSEITLDNGVSVSVKEDVRASIPKDVTRKANALAWLSSLGAGSLIHDVLTIEDPTEDLVSFIDEHGLGYERSRDVNAASLAAWFREKFGIKKGTVASMEVADVSPDVSCFRYRKTTIK
jgi:hypothetical protein